MSREELNKRIFKWVKFLTGMVAVGVSMLLIILFINYIGIRKIPVTSFYTEVFKSSPHLLMIKDKDSNIIAMSDSFYEVLHDIGISTVGMIGTPGYAFGEEALKVFMSHDRLAFNKGSTVSFEEEIAGYGRGTSYKTPILNSIGQPVGLSIIFILEKKYHD